MLRILGPSSSGMLTKSFAFHYGKLLALCIILTLFADVASAEHVHRLYYNNSNWVDQDLTALTGGGIAVPFGAIAAFYTTPNQQLHVYFVDTNSHVHQLFYNNTSWTDNDLTAFTGGPAAQPFGIAGFAIGNLQYVFYVSTDSHVHELNYNNADWTDQDLTALVGGNTASAAPLVAFATKPNNQFHVYYQDANSLHEYQLYFNGTSWTYQDLTAITGAYCYTQWAAGAAVGNLQHVICPGYGGFSNNLDVIDINYNNSTWVYFDITYLAGGPRTPLNLSSGIAAFPVLNQGEVYAVTDDTHVHQYTYKSGHWNDLDLTSSIGAPADPHFGGIVAFPTKPNNQFHVYYQPSNEVYQLYFNGTSWSYQDLTGGAGQASYNSGMAGFAIGNLQHVFYLASGN